MVLDADALNLLAEDPLHRDNWILTPHPGEAARLLGVETPAIQADRFGTVDQLQQRYGGVVVLKGAGTLVRAADANTGLCAQGNPGMASGGMGDILSGILGGLLAQGFTLNEAAQLGTCLHAAAGDAAAKSAGERGLLASDLLPWVRRLANPTVD
jgi:NAD(P)H-hydrate epimerase